MNQKRDDRARLLAEMIHDEWTVGPAAEFARTAAAHVRHRRARHRAAFSLAIGAAAAAMILVPSLIQHRPPPPSTAHRDAPARPEARGYEVISDTELLDQLHDRSLIMVDQPNGRRALVLLDK